MICASYQLKPELLAFTACSVDCGHGDKGALRSRLSSPFLFSSCVYMCARVCAFFFFFTLLPPEKSCLFVLLIDVDRHIHTHTCPRNTP